MRVATQVRIGSCLIYGVSQLGLHSAANFVIGSGGSIRPLSDGIGAGTTMRVTLRLWEPGPATPESDGGDA